jgi:CheY-like chemotaxis protein
MLDRQRPRLLIIDDDRAITSTLSPILRDMADADAAHTVAEALEKLAAHSYSGVVLDVVLGDDASPLHDALSSREVPVLLLSGRDPVALERIASARGWSYAAKPLSPTVIRGLVADLLGVDEPEPTQRGRVTQTPAAPDTSKASPAPAPVAVQLLDKLGDMVAMIAVTYLCAAGKLSGELAAAVVAGIAGVGTGLRAIGGRNVGAASAAVALAALITAAPAAVHAMPSNRTARPHHAALPGALAALALLLLSLAGCATMPDAPGATLGKVRGWWNAVCGAGDQALQLAERTAAALPSSDAGPPAADASPGALADASTENDR